MELSGKVKELEDEVKVLKAEIRNVLLDIREVILNGSNPLSEQQEPAYLRMDLTTTARSVAAEEAARAAREALDQAKGQQDTEEEPREPEEEAAEQAEDQEPTESELEEPEPEEPEEDAAEEAEDQEPTESELEQPAAEEPEEDAAEQAEDQEPTEDKPQEPEASGDGGPPPKRKASRKGKAPPDIPREAAALPPMQLAYMLPTGATGGLAAWVSEAMAAIGPQDLERVITIHRLWGSLPPNISYALAHLQRLIRSSKEADPAWLKIMQDMEKLASS